ncbi:hypothetical protein HQ535_03250 [bacterium]|nr:hypothetical protein [bacterium]
MRALADRSLDPVLPGGSALLDLVDAVLLGAGDGDAARSAVSERFGSGGLVRAAGVIGNFEMMNRLADGVGVPIGPSTLKTEAKLLASLGLDRIAH